MLRRFLQRLQQGVEGVLGQHVDFVDDVDLVARRHRPVAHAVDDLADVVHAGMAGGVHLHHVDVAVGGDALAVLADAAGRDRRPAGAVRAGAVERAGDDPGGRRLADAAHAGQHEGMRQTARLDGVGQGADQRFLADQFGEVAGAVFPREDPIGLGGAGRGGSFRRRRAEGGKRLIGQNETLASGNGVAASLVPDERMSKRKDMSDANCRGKIEVGGWTNDPSRNSLRLLPSGPDRVGEGLVRRQPPNAYMARGEPGSKRKRASAAHAQKPG